MKNQFDELATIKSADAGLKWLLCMVCGLLSSVTIHAQTSLVVNGGFETGDFTGWTTSGGNLDVDTDPDEEVHSGAYGAYIVGTEVGSLVYIFQTLDTIPGCQYLISTWVKGKSNRPFPPHNEFHVTWDGTNLFDAFNNLPPTGPYWDLDWTNVQLIAVASSQHTVLQFGFQDSGIQGGALGLDEVSVVLVGPTNGRPLVLTGPASEMGSFSATLNGTVWPNGPDTAVWFEYGTTTNYGSRTAMMPIASSNLAPVQVNSLVGGLSLQTLYHWRLVATNDAGVGFGLDSTFGAGPRSLVVNGGFETGDFTGWTQAGNMEDYDVDTDPEDVHSGTYGGFFGAGYVSQTLSTVPEQPYLVSFWLDNFYGPPPNHFRVSWGGATLYDGLDSGQFDWTFMAFRAKATGWSTELQFGFQNDVGGFGVDDVSVLPITPPEFLPGGLTVTNGNLALTWRSLPGLAYQLQYTTSLAAATWIDLGPPITATDLRTTALDRTGSDSRRFYRAVMLP